MQEARGQTLQPTLAKSDSKTIGLSEGSPVPEWALLPCYPNPFNPTTEIAFALPAPARVSLSIYDVLGRRIAALVDGGYEVGYHKVKWNAAGRASGIYYARLSVYDASGKSVYSKTNKLLLTK